MSAQPTRNGPIRPAGPLTVPSGIWANTPPLAMTARADATCCSIPTPPRQTGRSPPSRWTSHSRQREVNVDGPLPRNQTRGSVGQRVEHEERVHPAAVGRADEEIAAGRQVLLAGRVDPEPEDAEQHGPRRAAGRAGRGSRPAPRASGRARPDPRRRRRGRRRAPAARPGPAAAGVGAGRLIRSRARSLPASTQAAGVEPASSRRTVADRRRRRRRVVRVVGRPLGRSRSRVRPAGAVPIPQQRRARRARSRPTRSGPSGCRRTSSSRCAGTRARTGSSPYQTKKISSRSPGTSRESRRRASHSSDARADRARTATRTGTVAGSGSSRAGTSRTDTPRPGGRSRSRCPTAGTSAARTAPG